VTAQVAAVLYAGQEVVGSLTARSGRNNGVSNDDMDAKRVICMAHGQANAEIASDRATTLTCLHEAPIAAIPEGARAFIPADARNADTVRMMDSVPTLNCNKQGDNAPCVVAFSSNMSNPDFVHGVSPTVKVGGASGSNPPAVVFAAGGKEDREAADGACMTLKARMGTGGGNVPMVAMEQVAVPLKDPEDLLPESPTRKSTKGWGNEGDPAFTLRTAVVPGAAIAQVPAVEMVNMGGDKGGASTTTDGSSFTLATNEPHAVVIGATPVSDTLSVGANQTTGTHTEVVSQAMQVRRLTPEECEALQGFPRGWTQVPYRGKPAADGPRYKALGNSMATNCMEWIGERIQACEEGTL
jgi:DNA (cytosine-5)-methyltransferase 1